ncbi:MAG TPA: nucleotidyltransferase family protein [Chitinolyticbacter sp.]|nr:nucleotidyltransferase family protein [Chitinolyticbacter sp.]
MQKNWKDMLVAPTSSIRETVAVIDRLGSRAAFVVDADTRLLGLVTDGDLRRGLLRGVSLEAPVTEIMNGAPTVFAPSEVTSARARELLDTRGFLHLPVVEGGRLVDVIFAESLLAVPKRDNAVFLMAGGFGTRLKPLTETCPKPMLKVGSKPILQIILEGFKEAGFHRFYISTHYLPEVIHQHFGDGSRWGVSIAYVHEAEPLGTAGALGLLPESVGELPMVMMNGDLLTRLDFGSLLDFHTAEGAAATMCLREYSHQVPYGVVRRDGNSLTCIDEKPSLTFHVNAGIYVVGPQVRRAVAAGQRIDMPDLLMQQVQIGRKVGTYTLSEYWLDIGKMNDFERAQQDVAGLFGG